MRHKKYMLAGLLAGVLFSWVGASWSELLLLLCGGLIIALTLDAIEATSPEVKTSLSEEEA